MPIDFEEKSIRTLVQDVRDRRIVLPEMQRRYVWKSTQVRDLFDSLYREYPSGQLLVWQTDDLGNTRAISVESARNASKPSLPPLLLLDGQQRLTSLAAIVNGTDLIVKENKRSIDIVFNLLTEKFEVGASKHKSDPAWISLRYLYQVGAPVVLKEINDRESSLMTHAFGAIQRLEKILDYKYRLSVLRQLPYDEVTHIFVRINSAGTTLGNSDLALAQISSRWRGAGTALDKYETIVKKRTKGELILQTPIMIRTLAYMMSGRNVVKDMFRGDRQALTAPDLEAGWRKAIRALDQAIDFLEHNCRIDRLSLLPTQQILIPLAAFFHKHASVSDATMRGLQRWAYSAMMWSRYSGSSESSVDQDITALDDRDPVEALIRNIQDVVGKRPISERELTGKSKQSPFLLMAYVLARRNHASDWFTGVAIGSGQDLEQHHIFPKEALKEHYGDDLDIPLRDQVANLAFLTARANGKIRHTPPSDYLPKMAEEAPKRLEAQYVPMDPELWKLERFADFAKARRERLAQAINEFMHELSDDVSLVPSKPEEMLRLRVGDIERMMREVIADNLLEARGQHALDLIPKDVRASLQYRAELEYKKNPAMDGHYENLRDRLRLAQFSDYGKIVKQNWSLFVDEFGDLTTFEQHFKSVTDLRNSFAHDKPVSAFELHLGEGALLWLGDQLEAALERLKSKDEGDMEEE